MSEDLAKRIQVLEDKDAIQELKVGYYRLADAAIAGDESQWDEILSHFTEDVTADFVGMGQFKGKAALEKIFKETVPSIMTFSAHMILNSIIEVNGDTAKGSWYFFVAATIAGINKAAWIKGLYEDEFVRIDGKWKIKSLKSETTFMTPFDEGWVKTPMIGQ
jgi:hypothetical protein